MPPETDDGTLDGAFAHVVATALPDLAPGEPAWNPAHLPRVIATAQALAGTGDPGAQAVLRAWLWQGAWTMLCDLGGEEAEDVRTAYVPAYDDVDAFSAFVIGPDLTLQRDLQFDPLTGLTEATPQRWLALRKRLGACFPGTWTRADVERTQAIVAAEADRSQQRMALFQEMVEAAGEFPATSTLGEALRTAGVDMAELERRIAALPAPDELGLQWLIAEHERAERDGTLVCPKIPGLA